MYQIAYKTPTKGTQWVRTLPTKQEQLAGYTLTERRDLATSFSSDELANVYVRKITSGKMGPALSGRLLFVEQEA